MNPRRILIALVAAFAAPLALADTIAMIGATLAVAYYVIQAQNSATPEEYFVPFLLLFLVQGFFEVVERGVGEVARTRFTPFMPFGSEARLGLSAFSTFLPFSFFGISPS